MSQYTKIRSPFPGDWQPAYISEGLERVLNDAHALTGVPIVIGQPPYNTRNKASAGTHDKRNCADLYGTHAELVKLDKALRLLGWPGWIRTPDQGNWPLHFHFFKHGDSGLASLALLQDTAYVAGYNGLGKNARGGRDYGFQVAARDTIHVPKQTDKFVVVAKGGTHSYSQPVKTQAHMKTERAKGFEITNHLTTVSVDGKQFIVTKNFSFYDRTKLNAVR